MHFETSIECNTDKINHDTILQKISQVMHFKRKKSKMHFEKSTALQKYPKSYISNDKLPNALWNITWDITDKINRDTTLKEYPKSYVSNEKLPKYTLKLQLR